MVILRYWQTRTRCCGHIVVDTNVSLFVRARNICCGHNFVSRTQKVFLILFRNILCPHQMFPSLCAQGNVMSNNVSATMFPRLPSPLGRVCLGSIRNKNSWNNASKRLFGSYSHSGIPGFPSRLFCSQEQNSRNIFLFRNIPNERTLKLPNYTYKRSTGTSGIFARAWGQICILNSVATVKLTFSSYIRASHVPKISHLPSKLRFSAKCSVADIIIRHTSRLKGFIY